MSRSIGAHDPCVIESAGTKKMTAGTVKWFNDKNCFGFIAPDDGSDDLLFRYSVIDASGYKTLEEGQKVSFGVIQGPRGGRQAVNVTAVQEKDGN